MHSCPGKHCSGPLNELQWRIADHKDCGFKNLCLGKSALP